MTTSSRPRALLALSFAWGGSLVPFGSSPLDTDPLPGTALAAPSCSEDCNRKASDCLDVCEDKFKNDDRARVTCKFECSQERQKCEKNCG